MCVTADNDFLAGGEQDDGFTTRERVVVSKCYSKIETSSSQHQIKKWVGVRLMSGWVNGCCPISLLPV